MQKLCITQISQSPLQLLPINGVTLAPGQSRTLSGKVEVLPTVDDGTYTVVLRVKANGEFVQNVEIKVHLDRNILNNSDFENGIDHWYVNGNGGVWDTENSYSGNGSMRLDIVPGYYSNARTNQLLRLEPNKPYKFSAWIKAETEGNMYVNFVAHDETWSVIQGGETQNLVDIGTDWTYIELTYTRDPDKDYDFDFIYYWYRESSAGGTGTVWIDDVKLSLIE